MVDPTWPVIELILQLIFLLFVAVLCPPMLEQRQILGLCFVLVRKNINAIGMITCALNFLMLLHDISFRPLVVSAAICSMLENWSGMNKEKAKEYILNCQVCKSSALLFCGILPCCHALRLKLAIITYVFSFDDISLYLLLLFFQSYDGGFGLIPGSESHGEWIRIMYYYVICLHYFVHVWVAVDTMQLLPLLINL